MASFQEHRANLLLQPDQAEQNNISSGKLRQHLEHLYQDFPIHGFHRNQEIPLVEDKVWVVIRGVVTLNTLHPSGDESLLGLAMPSMPFGIPLTRVLPYSAISLSNTELLQLSMTDIARSPSIQQALVKQLSRRLQQSESLAALLGLRRVEDRLKQFLLLLAEDLGEPIEAGRRISVRLTHHHLASALGTTRVTVTRILNQLRCSGWLSIDQGRRIVITGR